MGAEIFLTLKKVLHDRGLSTAVGDEGGRGREVQDQGDRKGRFCRRVRKTGQGELRNSGKLVSDQSFEGLIFAITPSKSV